MDDNHNFQPSHAHRKQLRLPFEIAQVVEMKAVEMKAAEMKAAEMKPSSEAQKKPKSQAARPGKTKTLQASDRSRRRA